MPIRGDGQGHQFSLSKARNTAYMASCGRPNTLASQFANSHYRTKLIPSEFNLTSGIVEGKSIKIGPARN
jgi:hypothetical protein